MNSVIFQSSDLATQRTEVLKAARNGRALVRDKDGTGLVMLPEQDLNLLEQYAAWSQIHARLSVLIESDQSLTVGVLGDLAWLRVFDRDDIAEFAAELHSSLVAGLSDRDITPVEETVHAWRVTAKQLEDPLRRSVLLERVEEGDLLEAPRPESE